MKYTTREGDTVANIAWNHYGTSAGYTEQILTAPENYGLSKYPAFLPAGLIIRMPQANHEEAQQKSTLNLWD